MSTYERSEDSGRGRRFANPRSDVVVISASFRDDFFALFHLKAKFVVFAFEIVGRVERLKGAVAAPTKLVVTFAAAAFVAVRVMKARPERVVDEVGEELRRVPIGLIAEFH